MFDFPLGKRYNPLTQHLRQKFGHRLQKVSVDAGFTCPNRDGSVAIGGCTYCNNSAFNPSYCSPQKGISQQIAEGIEFHERRYRRAGGFLVYFQPYSNTYASIDKLQALYSEALSAEGVVGISVSTRPDCFNDEIAQILADIGKSKIVLLELGIESVRNSTLQRINRGHSFEITIEAFEIAKKHQLFTTGHYILGLPGETREQMLDDTKVLNTIPMNAIKLHQLQIVRDTAMECDFRNLPADYQLFELAEYIDFVVSFTEHLRPDLLIDRLAGEVPPAFLVAPDWGLIRYDSVLRRIEKRFEELDTYQGKYLMGN
jgi:radical SAM protein (TIGR01212 family)